ncbi:MAG TPA: inorganic diphosphatase, partial [Candidatus Acidoferrum sp.]
LKRFFSDYKQLEGKKVEVEDIRPAYAAVTVIERALARYQTERERLLDEPPSKSAPAHPPRTPMQVRE